jgi:hypothetical protein
MNMLSRLGAVALAAPVVLAPSAIGETLPGGSKPSEMMPSVIQIPNSSPSSRNPSLSINNAANGSRPDAASVAQVSREVAQEDANKQQPTNSQSQGDEQPSNSPIVPPPNPPPNYGRSEAGAIADLEMQIRETINQLGQDLEEHNKSQDAKLQEILNRTKK